jgi:hypothetical protein
MESSLHKPNLEGVLEMSSEDARINYSPGSCGSNGVRLQPHDVQSHEPGETSSGVAPQVDEDSARAETGAYSCPLALGHNEIGIYGLPEQNAPSEEEGKQRGRR